ncbi:unnamed protein product [Lepeophtheirus salmonis]|uniref:(salmon louse) hypothetical protein n=1 Tax=Lepeophtheirus salmonis TaxID=72036 RepID=A0A7R8H165_LEPSM|nr:unnamed protein product [Lepeophtheirus salmonis]CAF2805794.1 unnamed protein product [Lepeophtheirus salmonis]
MEDLGRVLGTLCMTRQQPQYLGGASKADRIVDSGELIIDKALTIMILFIRFSNISYLFNDWIYETNISDFILTVYWSSTKFMYQQSYYEVDFRNDSKAKETVSFREVKDFNNEDSLKLFFSYHCINKVHTFLVSIEIFLLKLFKAKPAMSRRGFQTCQILFICHSFLVFLGLQLETFFMGGYVPVAI